MGSKVLLTLGLLLAIVLLVSSEVAARDLASTEAKSDAKEVNHEYGGGGGGRGGYGGGGRGGYGGGGGRGGYGGGGRGGYGGGGRGGGGRGGYGGGCYHGCCGGGYHGGCRCCRTAEEAVQYQTQVKPHN